MDNKANRGALILLFTVLAAVLLFFTRTLDTPVHAQATYAGVYIGNGLTTQVATGGTLIKSLRIVTVPARGLASEAYTTATIQNTNGSGTFLNGSKKDNGVSLERGTFTVTNPEFNESGVVYHWEANGF